MLQGMTKASPPSARIDLATSSQASALRLDTTTFAPSCANSSAVARPMPRLEPVMTATLPVRSNGDCFNVLLPSSHRPMRPQEGTYLAYREWNPLLGLL